MTAEQPLDRTTRAWLDLMPDEAPDRVIDAVLLAVESAPRVRRPWLAGPTRSNQMNRFVLIAAAAIVGVALLGGAALIAGGNTGPAPTQAPPSAAIVSPAPSSPASPGAVTPAGLKYTWVGAPRDIPGRGMTTRISLQFSSTGACINSTSASPGCVIASSRLDEATRNTLQFSTPSAGDCAAGDNGTYPYTLSPGGKVLTIATGTDACAVRAAAYPGTWYRALCTEPANGCLGDLEADTYPSQFIAPKLDASAQWDAPWGALSYTVPAGWSNSVDFPMELILLPSTTYATFTAQGGPANVYHQLQVLADPVAVKQDAACSFGPDPTVPRTADAIATWLAGLPTVTATNAISTTINGKHARQLDLAVNAATARTCPGDTFAGVPMFAPARTDTGNVPQFGIGVGELVQLTLVDIGGGHVAGIVIDDGSADHIANPTRFQQLVDAATPIVESLHFQ